MTNDDDVNSLVYLDKSMNPSLCLMCGGRFVAPAEWQFVDFDAMIIRCECPNCDSSYGVIMSMDQAEFWDDDLHLQKFEMGMDADAMRIDIEREMVFGSQS